MSPVVIPKHLPANQILRSENIFVMNRERAMHQDIRPLHILIVNLMPLKEVTEAQLLRLLGNTTLQVEITLLHMATHESKNTSQDHLKAFYQTLEDVKSHRYDAMIVTGAPVETLPFESVNYWKEFRDILEWAKTNVFSTMYICWAAQAGLYANFGINKHGLAEKLFGVFKHEIHVTNEPLFRGFDDSFFAPHSRHTEVNSEAIQNHEDLDILATSKQAGVYIVANKTRNQFFVTGHPEYDRDTLAREFFRDRDKGMNIDIPSNYFEDDDPNHPIHMSWKGHAHLLFSNWLNYYVYQLTDFNFIERK
jgi:homoserine O-succinyltransferase